MLPANELQTFEALHKHLGARIMFDCDKVTYRGIIDTVSVENHQVRLRHVVIVQGNHYLGNLRFKFHEIKSFTVVESSESVNRYPVNEYLLNILKNNKPVPSKKVAKALYDLPDESDEDDETPDETINQEKFVLDLPSHLEHSLPKDYIQVNSFNDDFDKVVQYIGTQQVIGVSFHGSQISRFGKLIWVCISTDICSYLFDILQLGKEAFEKGLKDIFESKSIKKVIHDSRFISDCLAHQYATDLNNVFDTRVADFVISMQRYNEQLKFYSFSTLDCLLRSHLNVPQEFIFERETAQSSTSEEAFFSKRPVSNEYLYDLLKSVVYLRLLQERLSKELQLPLHKITDYHQNVLSAASSKLIKFLGSDLSRPDQIPWCVLMNGFQTVTFQRPKAKDLSFKCIFTDPKSGNEIIPNLHSPAASKDSLLKRLNQTQQQKHVFHEKVVDNKACVTLKEKINPLISDNNALSTNNSITNVSEGLDYMDFTSKPSFRQLDEVYHKLVHQMVTKQSESVVSVKPSCDYTSTFIGESPIASHSNGKCDLQLKASDESSDDNIDNFSDCSSESSKTEIEESNDIWSKIRAEILAERATCPSADIRERKFIFVPG